MVSILTVATHYTSTATALIWQNWAWEPSGDGYVVCIWSGGGWNDLPDTTYRDAVRQFEPKSTYQAVNETYRD
ncbi:MAG UNVERIFIED_CONTAM: hypothetical protein LVR18_35225 [Planctomycetaceae bacterium]